jgi:glycogen debranching enzyme
MSDVLRLDEPFSILSGGNRSGTPTRVLKHGDTFGVFDLYGDVATDEAGEQGLYHDGTRYLSRFELRLGPFRPLLLGSTISDDNTLLAVDLTNPDFERDGSVLLPHGTIHLFRSRVLWKASCLERIRVTSHGLAPVELPITILVDADFADLFEVRGTKRRRHGRRLPDRLEGGLVLGYVGLDGLERRLRLRWSVAPDHVESRTALYLLRLNPHEVIDIELRFDCETDGAAGDDLACEAIASAVRHERSERAAAECAVLSSHEGFNRWWRRSSADLHMMTTETAAGPYPYAGIPWFSTPFGRDGIITALELLWAAPDVARGVLRFLAGSQATEVSPAQDAEPGKILHEMRSGEMAALGEIPFGRYYGSADATPLFVMLADAYVERTGDLALLDELWPHVLAALSWMQTYGDLDEDGFIEYARKGDAGLVQQGWKDSNDSVFHADGTLASPPIALCEIQGYAYAAWSGASRLAAMRGDAEASARWRARAERLQRRFEEAFWCEELGTYALAVDAAKRPCRIRTSNPGHCLLTGIVSPERAPRVVEALMSDTSFAGWGIRTVSAGQARYNPMSYHNGSIWPHDTALVAAGLARYGFTREATTLMGAMLALSQAVESNRLPELICGFHRRGGQAPTLYPVACAPQSWAAGVVYLLLQACLGMRIEATSRRVVFDRAVLPESLEWIRLTNLRVADASVDLLLTRQTHDVGIRVLRRTGGLEIVAVK